MKPTIREAIAPVRRIAQTFSNIPSPPPGKADDPWPDDPIHTAAAIQLASHLAEAIQVIAQLSPEANRILSNALRIANAKDN